MHWPLLIAWAPVVDSRAQLDCQKALRRCVGVFSATITTIRHDAEPGDLAEHRALTAWHPAFRNAADFLFESTQTFEEIINIIKSQPAIKGINLRGKATFFGVQWAASQDQTFFSGMIDRWLNAEHKILMIKWEGWDRCRQAELLMLDKDSDGESVELELLPYDDGRPPPTLIEDEDEPDAGDDHERFDGGNAVKAASTAATTTTWG